MLPVPGLHGAWLKETDFMIRILFQYVLALFMLLCMLGLAPLQEYQTRSYVLHTDLDEESARQLAAHLDTTFDAYNELFAAFRSKPIGRMDAYVFATREGYIEFLAREFKVDGTGSGGMFVRNGSRRALLSWKGDNDMDRVRSVLQHEGFHQFADALFPALPVWANEGFAELFENGVEVDGRIVVGEVPPDALRRLQQARSADGLVHFDRFFEVDSAEWGSHVRSGQASLNYLQAWALVHFFIYAQDARWRDQFMDFLDRLNRGMKWRQAFRQVFEVESWSEIEEAFLAHLDAMRPTDYQAIVWQLEFLAAGMHALNQEGVFPTTLQMLKQQLQTRNFEFTSALFGTTRRMKASEESLYRLPGTDGSASMPHLALADNRGTPFPGAAGPGKRPWNIRTVGLEPRDFMVRWTRKGRNWRYSLEVD